MEQNSWFKLWIPDSTGMDGNSSQIITNGRPDFSCEQIRRGNKKTQLSAQCVQFETILRKFLIM